MRIFYLISATALLLFHPEKVFADEVYFLNNLQNCQIEVRKNKALVPVEDLSPFTNTILNVTKIPNRPDYVAFKYKENLYVTRDVCVIDAHTKVVDNRLVGNEYKKKIENTSEKEKFGTYTYFVELDSGMVGMFSDSVIVSDYNSVRPDEDGSFGPTSGDKYKTDLLINLGFGFRSTHQRFVVFKLRLFKGKKTDRATFTDSFSGLTEERSWSYKDNFKNFYIGHKYIFRESYALKPTLSAYVGLSQMSSTMSDGTESFSFSSLFPSLLVEGGAEYHFNSHWGVGGNIGLEYLGTRKMKYRANTGSDFKTDMSYTNYYLSIGAKYYFK